MPITDHEVQDGLLTVCQSDEGECIRLSLQGELDLSNVPTVESKLDELWQSENSVLVDLSKLEFLDSTGIALLIASLKRDHASRLTFVPSETESVRRLLRLTGLDEKLPLAGLKDGQALLPAA